MAPPSVPIVTTGRAHLHSHQRFCIYHCVCSIKIIFSIVYTVIFTIYIYYLQYNISHIIYYITYGSLGWVFLFCLRPGNIEGHIRTARDLFYVIATSKVISRQQPICASVVHAIFAGTGCRWAALAAPLASIGLTRCEAVLHGYGTNLLEGCTNL